MPWIEDAEPGSAAPAVLTDARRGFDAARWTATELLSPAIALISVRPTLGVLLARNACVERGRTTLHGVTWIRIPRGWRLSILQALSCLRPVRLAERRFNDVELSLEFNGMFVARVPGWIDPAGVLPHPSEAPYAVKMLTGPEYGQLARIRGRQLHRQVIRLFHDVPGVEEKQTSRGIAYGWTHRKPPWPIIAG